MGVSQVVRIQIGCGTLPAQLSPKIFDPRKMDSNFLEANFGYFRLSKAWDNKNNENCLNSFLVFGLKSYQITF